LDIPTVLSQLGVDAKLAASLKPPPQAEETPDKK
jgi:hypothetical protein